MPVFSYQSDLLNPEMAAACVLRMIVGVNGVSLTAANGEKVLALKSWSISGSERDFQSVESELRAIFGAEPLLDLPFREKYCYLSTAASTLVPRRLFDPNSVEKYFKMLLREGQGRSYGFEPLDLFDCHLVWAADDSLFQLCTHYFPQANIKHLAVPLLRAYTALAPADGYAVFANLRGQRVQIAVFERQNLAFFNVFDYSKPNDLLYYVLLAYKQFNLDPLEIPLTLSGTLLEDSEIFKQLTRYIRPLRFPPLVPGYQWPEAANALPKHYWFDLSSLGS